MDYAKLTYLKEHAANDFAKRLSAELEYGLEVSKTQKDAFDGVLSAATALAEAEARRTGGCLSQETLVRAEQILAPLGVECKKQTLLCVAHAHIDMCWEWGFDETVAVTEATLRTMLKLMDEYPNFKFSQSQAAVYKMVEEFDPELFAEIGRRVKEGRWEVSASTWVETDKNLVNGEGLTRHILYTKRYFAEKFGLPPDALALDFEPDTFGHNGNVPEICANGGVKYYYFCRGKYLPEIFRWEAPSGKSLLCYREPFWYNAEINYNEFTGYPQLFAKYGIQTLLKVYGVGDHGGGATRRDIERLIAMNEWPLMPNLKFSTYREFFATLEREAPKIETFRGELNAVFTGCYTSQTRMKAANRRGEKLFYETEKLTSYTDAMGLTDTDREDLRRAWRRHLFNHFHDILPGSNVIDSREYASGRAQDRNAILGMKKTKSLLALSAAVDTSQFSATDLKETVSEGAGAGFWTAGHAVFAGNMSAGEVRMYLLFNYADCARDCVTELTLWDFPGSVDGLGVRDAAGNLLDFEVVDREQLFYRCHSYRRLRVRCTLPANGYKVVAVTADNDGYRSAPLNDFQFWRNHPEDRYVLENDLVCAEFDPDTAALVRFEDKRTGVRVGGEGKPVGYFKFVEEDGSKNMTAWVVGHYLTETPLLRNVRIDSFGYRPGGLRKSLDFTVPCGERSELKVTVSLDEGAECLDFHVATDWKEFGDPVQRTPSLLFEAAAPAGAEFWYDVPFGLLRREPARQDLPAGRFVCGFAGKGGVVLGTDSKHGFRCNAGTMSVNLIRSSSDPDRLPENYSHDFHVYLALHEGRDARSLNDLATTFGGGVDYVSFLPAKGALPAEGSAFVHEGRAVLSAIKRAEDGSGIVCRLYEADGAEGDEVLRPGFPFAKAFLCDGNENILEELPVRDGTVSVRVPADTVVAVLMR